MTLRIAAVAFVLCFVLGSGILRAGDAEPKKDSEPKADGKTPDGQDPKHNANDKPSPPRREAPKEEDLQKKQKEYSDYLESHFPLDRTGDKNDVDYFRDLILEGPEKAGAALGELMGSIYNAEKAKVLAGQECKKEGEKFSDQDAPKPFYRYLCSAAAYKDGDKEWEKDNEPFRKAFLSAKSSKDAANQSYASAKEKIASIEEKLQKEGLTQADRDKLIKEREELINNLVKNGKFDKNDFSKYATSQYSRKTAATTLPENGPERDFLVKQTAASVAAMRLGATTDTKTGALNNTYNVDGKDVNVQVGQLGAPTKEDQKLSDWALKALAASDKDPKPGVNKVKFTPYKADNAVKMGVQKDDSGFKLVEGEGFKPSAVAVKPAEEKKPDAEKSAAPKLGQIFSEDPKVASKCASCHNDGKEGKTSQAEPISFANGKLQIGGSERNATQKNVLANMPFFAKVLKDPPEGAGALAGADKETLRKLKLWLSNLPPK